MMEKYLCKKCKKVLYDYDLLFAHLKACFPSDYEGVLFTTYRVKPKEEKRS